MKKLDHYLGIVSKTVRRLGLALAGTIAPLIARAPLWWAYPLILLPWVAYIFNWPSLLLAFLGCASAVALAIAYRQRECNKSRFLRAGALATFLWVAYSTAGGAILLFLGITLMTIYYSLPVNGGGVEAIQNDGSEVSTKPSIERKLMSAGLSSLERLRGQNQRVKGAALVLWVAATCIAWQFGSTQGSSARGGAGSPALEIPETAQEYVERNIAQTMGVPGRCEVRVGKNGGSFSGKFTWSQVGQVQTVRGKVSGKPGNWHMDSVDVGKPRPE